MFNKDTLGKLFVDELGNLWVHETFQDQPTATLRRLGMERKAQGAVGSPVLADFRLATPDDLAKSLMALDQESREG